MAQRIFQVDENGLKLYCSDGLIMHFKWVHFMVYKLYFNKVVWKKIIGEK